MGALAASIREVGLLQPVLVRELEDEEDSYELIAGDALIQSLRSVSSSTHRTRAEPPLPSEQRTIEAPLW